MNITARFYLCVLCRIQTIICSPCDRGNIYCSALCSETSRSTSCKAANQRYQSTLKGRKKNAAHQACYRIRKKKVTDQGSPLPPVNDLLPVTINKPFTCPVRCGFCGRTCSVVVRRGFLTRQERRVRRFYRDDQPKTMRKPTMTINSEKQAAILRLHYVEKWTVGTIARQLSVHHSLV